MSVLPYVGQTFGPVMPCTVRQIVEWFEELAPPHLAEDWDNVGLQIGHPDAPVNKVLLALTVTPSVVEQARELAVDLIVAHHPVIFRPLQALRWDRPETMVLRSLVKTPMSVFVAHTNYDIAARGTSLVLAKRLGINQSVPLAPTEADDSNETGLGRVGQLDLPVRPNEFLQHVVTALDQPTIRHCGPIPSKVGRVAVMGGSGGSYMKQAASVQADVYITGDIDFHDALLADDLGLWVIDAGHFATERLILPFWKQFLDSQAQAAGLSLESFVAKERDPFQQYP